MASHICATTILLENEVPIEMVKEILSHFRIYQLIVVIAKNTIVYFNIFDLFDPFSMILDLILFKTKSGYKK